MFNKTGEEYIGLENSYYSDSISDLAHCCGVVEVGGFNELPKYNDDRDVDWDELALPVRRFEEEVTENRTGLFITNFINNKICKDAYNWFASKYTLVSQTAPYRNNGTGNKVFVAVWYIPTKQTKKAKRR